MNARRKGPGLPIVLFLGALVFAGGCGASQEPETSKVEAVEEKPERGRKRSEDDVSETGKSWGGWRYRGKRDDCFYKFKRRCFRKKKKACKAAGCKKADCVASDAAPAVVSCKGD